MVIKIRNYPLSTKLTVQNNALLVADIFVSLCVFLVLFMLFGGQNAERSNIANGIIIVMPILSFYVIQWFINKMTDQKYEMILEEYKLKLAKLTLDHPEDVKDKILSFPAKVKLTRLKANQGKLQKQKFYINGTQHVLKNGESVEFSTNRALNWIETKQLGAKDIKYFTVSDNEHVEITYLKYIFNDIDRKQTLKETI